jgi:hypothetical protein
MAEENGDLEGVLEMGMSNLESVEGLGGNVASAKDLIASGLRG